jgi:hypothetical protein
MKGGAPRTSGVMAGLVPAIHVFLIANKEPRYALDQRVVEIIPLRIDGVDKAYLPGAGPVFDRFFALNRVSNIVKALCINQSLQAVMLCKSVDKPPRCS